MAEPDKEKNTAMAVGWGSGLEIEKERAGTIGGGPVMDDAENAVVFPVPDVLPAVGPKDAELVVQMHGTPRLTAGSPQGEGVTEEPFLIVEALTQGRVASLGGLVAVIHGLSSGILAVRRKT